MESVLNQIVDGLFGGLGLFFEHRWVAPLVLGPLMFGAAFFLWWRSHNRLKPYLLAASHRVDALRKGLGSEAASDAERLAFAENYDAIREAMERETRGARPLVLAWREFHETIIDETESPIRNTARPSGFFMRAIPRPLELAFWSNTFVALGLLLTFLGIVVALNKTAVSMDGGDIAATQGALHDLLTIASVKFFTSIAGVGCSVLLRFAEAGLARRVDRLSADLCDLLERGLLYVSPQVLAVRQLDELKRQSAQLEKFNTDLALQIGEQVGAQFQSAISPIAASLGHLNDNIGGMSDRLGEGVGKAIEGAASGELRALGHTLNALREQLEGLTSHVQGSGEEAARQIRAAGTDFAQAAQDIREAFAGLSANVEGMGAKLANENEAASTRQREALDDALAAFRGVSDEVSKGLRASLEALQTAGVAAGANFQARIGDAMASAADDAEAAVRRAIEKTGEGLEAAGQNLASAVERAAADMRMVAKALQEAEQGTAANARNLKETADGVRTVTSALGQAATGFASAAAPVAEASKSFRDAADRIGAAAERNEHSAATTLKEINALAAGVSETHEAAAQAWSDYRGRFAEVDKALERTVQQMVGALESSLAEFRSFASEIDTQLGSAVGRLAPVVDTIRDNSEEIAELAKALRAPSKVAAE